MIRVTVWNEFYHEKNDPRTAAVYPDGLHMAIKRMLECEDVTVRTATLDDPECGLTEEVLADTDVLVWWGHVRHQLVPDEVAKRVQMHVLSGMGLIVLHSGHKSKPFMRLMGTTCSLTWNEVGERERVFVIDPAHPIAKGLPAYFEVSMRKCTASTLTCPPRTSWCCPRGSSPARSSAAAAYGAAATARYSTSSPATRPTPPTTKTSMYAPSSATPCAMWPALLG